MCIVAPLKTRQKNKVDELIEKIKKIQDNCEHTFRCLEEINLRQSRVEGIFLISEDGDVFRLYLRCLRCSKEIRASVTHVCPKCLGNMHPLTGLEDREKYFGEKYLYHAARHYECTECKFHGVADEWDQ